MSVETAYATPGRKYEIRTEVLAGDHRLLLQLLGRFEQTEDCDARRDLMQLAIDLFEVHSALEAARPHPPELEQERERVYALMEQAENAGARSPRHYVCGVALKRALEGYFEREEMAGAALPPVLHLERSGTHRALLRERASLVGYAMILLRLH